MVQLTDYCEFKAAIERGDAGWASSVLEYLGWRSDCLFCAAPLVPAFHVPHPWSVTAFQAHNYVRVHVDACVHCGWWQMEKTNDVPSGGSLFGVLSATLHSYDIDSNEAPIRALRRYLEAHSEAIHSISPRKMEELTQSVLKDFFQCEVLHVGHSHDRGIDLLVVNSEYTFPIQIKRRSHPNATESVKTVREMFGVMYRDGYRRAAVVTSAKRYSREAKREVDEVLSTGRCDQFQLIDRDSFLSILAGASSRVLPCWRHALPDGDEISSVILSNDALREFRRRTDNL